MLLLPTRRRASTRSVLIALVALSACSETKPGDSGAATTEQTCTRSDALVVTPFRGTSLPPKTLALSFDDGPGARTAELSAWLVAQGIHATFFVNGQWDAVHPGAIAQVVADGHAIANHTQDHKDLTSATAFPAGAAGDAALVGELTDTDAIIAPFVPHARFMFRAPYGAYDARDYSVLHASPMNKYVGPIHWDVGGTRTATTGADWACWQNAPKLTTKACGDLYSNEIATVGHGIVLMHDQDYGDNTNASWTTGVGNTIEMVKYLVPILRAQGYSFVRVEDVPEIAAALPPIPPPPVDAGTDAGSDAGKDAGTDAGKPDAGTDAGKPDAKDAGSSVPPASSDPLPPPAASPCVAPAPRSDDAH